MTGTTLSHYDITAELGRGGMGIVYKARDTKLDRDVAIKVLPSAALASSDDRERFYREAKAAAALNHPNIAQVYQIDEAIPEGGDSAESRPFIAMEYIDGETLDSRIKKGPLKLSEAVGLGRQIAGALGEAHEKGIVHRDVKASNVMLTSKGDAKVLDFGLALTAASTKLTRMGSTLGTVAYMSPEQARGEEVDRRTDLWALGVVLYEMVAGRNPFGGDYEQAVVYGILNAEPEPLTSLRTGVPMQLEWIVNKLLAKDAEYRYQTAAGLVADLKGLDLSGSGHSSRMTTATSAVSTPTDPSTSTPAKPGWLIPAAVIALLVIGGLLSALLMPRQDTQPRPTLSVSVDVPGYSNEALPSISPDGRYVAFTSSAERGRSLVIVDLSTGESHAMSEPGVEFRMSRFSPDGEWLVYERGDYGLGIVSVPDGIPAVLVDTGTNPAWLDEETIAFNLDSGIALIDRISREVTVVFDSDLIWTLNAVGDGRHILISMFDEKGPQMGVFDVKSEDLTMIGAGLAPRFVAPGHILFHDVEEQTVWSDARPVFAQAFDVSSKKLLGAPVQVMSERQSWTMDVSSKGHLFALKENRLSSIQGTLSRVDPAKGIAEPFPWRDDVTRFNSLGLSGDGEWIAYSSGELNAEIYVREMRRGDASPVVLQNERYSITYRLSEDGTSVHYNAGGGSVRPVVYSTPTDGSGLPVKTFDDESLILHDRSSDGRYWALADPGNAAGLYFSKLQFLDTVADTRVRVDSTIQIRIDTGRFSPDFEYFAFDGRADGETEGSYVIRTDGSGPWRIGSEGDPFWSPDGSSLYLERENEVVEVKLDFSRGVRAVADFRTVYRALGLQTADIFPDGSLLVVSGGDGNLNEASLQLVLDWGQRLDEIAPGN